MSKAENRQLLKFLKPFPETIQDTALWLRDFIWDLYPGCNELIYDNYNAVAVGWSLSEKLGHTFCSIAVGRTSYNVHFGFYFGSVLSDPKKLLLGNGNQYRYILVKEQKGFPKTYVKSLLKEAYKNALAKVKNEKDITHGLTVVKSISANKRTKGN